MCKYDSVFNVMGVSGMNTTVLQVGLYSNYIHLGPNYSLDLELNGQDMAFEVLS